MMRVRAAIASVIVVCVAVVALVAFSSGDDDGPQTFMASDAVSAVLLEWTRVGDDVSGSLTLSRVSDATPGLLADNRLLNEKARDILRDSTAFTGTISEESVRLRLDGGALGTRVNGRLDGDNLTLVIPQANEARTVRLTTASRQDFNAVVSRVRAAETRRAATTRSTREQADAKARAAITRVATAYQKALDPSSTDDPCRYLTNAAKAELLEDTSDEPDLASRGCESVIRFRERDRPPSPKQLGVATIKLRTLVDVASKTTGGLADGAELRFAAIKAHFPIGLVNDGGEWRIAKYQ